jgi:hypothetical protein
MEKGGRVEGGNKVEKGRGVEDGKMWEGLRMGIKGWLRWAKG